MKSYSRVRLFATPWTVAYQAPQSVEFSRQKYWSGLPFPSPGDLPNPGIECGSPTLQADRITFTIALEILMEPRNVGRWGKLWFPFHNHLFICEPVCFPGGSVAQTVKCLSTMRETWVQSLGWEDPLEKEMATQSSTLA